MSGSASDSIELFTPLGVDSVVIETPSSADKPAEIVASATMCATRESGPTPVEPLAETSLPSQPKREEERISSIPGFYNKPTLVTKPEIALEQTPLSSNAPEDQLGNKCQRRSTPERMKSAKDSNKDGTLIEVVSEAPTHEERARVEDRSITREIAESSASAPWDGERNTLEGPVQKHTTSYPIDRESSVVGLHSNAVEHVSRERARSGVDRSECNPWEVWGVRKRSSEAKRDWKH